MHINLQDIEGRTSTIQSTQVQRSEHLDTATGQAWSGIVERRDRFGQLVSWGDGTVWLDRNEASMFAVIRSLEAGESKSWPL